MVIHRALVCGFVLREGCSLTAGGWPVSEAKFAALQEPCEDAGKRGASGDVPRSYLARLGPNGFPALGDGSEMKVELLERTGESYPPIRFTTRSTYS
jgi:hypothetical protein